MASALQYRVPCWVFALCVVVALPLGYAAARYTDRVVFYTHDGERRSFPTQRPLAGLDVGFYVAIGESVRKENCQKVLNIAEMCLDSAVLEAWNRRQSLDVRDDRRNDLDRVLRVAARYRQRYPREKPANDCHTSVAPLMKEVDRILLFYTQDMRSDPKGPATKR